MQIGFFPRFNIFGANRFNMFKLHVHFVPIHVHVHANNVSIIPICRSYLQNLYMFVFPMLPMHAS